MRKSVFILFLSLMNFFAFAQEEVRDVYDDDIEEKILQPPVVEKQQEYIGQTAFSVVDTSIFYQQYYLPTDSINAYKTDKRYKAIANADEQLRKWKASVMNKVPKQNSRKSGWVIGLFAGNVISVILWILAGVFVAFILYKLVLNKGLFRGGFSRSKVEQTDLTEDEKFLQQDFASLAKSSEEKNDLRLAMRYNFLFTLNKLKERGLIEFQIEKTNRKYLAELAADYKPDFAKLARYYEYAWYGNISFDEEEYEQIKSAFQIFNKSI